MEIGADVGLKKYDDYKNNSDFNNDYKSIDISQIKQLKVRTPGGKIKEISPRNIANITQKFIDDILTDKETSFLAPYLQKKIIWTLSSEAPTAFTDGVRICINVIFAYMCLSAGGKYARSKEEEIDNNRSLTDNEKTYMHNSNKGRYIKFIIIHEIYHQLYNHMRRERLKLGSARMGSEHALANIAMDMEINRDIESQMPEFDGCTQTLSGVWFKDPKYGKVFNHETWETIYDYLLEHDFNYDNNMPHPTPSPRVHPKVSDAYKKGWDKAVDAIKNKAIDPTSI